MPVIDHEVHPSTRILADHRYGCWNREEYAGGYYAPDGLDDVKDIDGFKDARIRLKYIPNVLSKDCRYGMSVTDPSCSGCRHRGEGEEYAGAVRKDGA